MELATAIVVFVTALVAYATVLVRFLTEAQGYVRKKKNRKR